MTDSPAWSNSPPILGSIPATLRAQRRWAPWVAKWSVQRAKFDKIPRRADHPEYGLSTADPGKWFAFEHAQRTYLANKDVLAGVGYVMTERHGVVGIDLDDCVDADVYADSGGECGVAPWAQAVVDRMGGYAELSPSGRGLRIFVRGEAEDWTNHQVGVEVYDGSAPRFLTVTGARLPGASEDVQDAPMGALEWLAATYRQNRVAKAKSGALGPPPARDVAVPGLDDLLADMPVAVRDFLHDGDADGGDRSKLVYRATIALTKAGLDTEKVLSVLVDNRYCMDVARDHRQGDDERARLYLWEHHVLPAAQEVGGNMLRDDDFERLAAEDAGGDAAPAPKVKFHLYTTDQFMAQRRRMEWFIRGVLPRGELGVMFGASGAGKTFCLLHMLVHMALGREWCGYAVVRPWRIVYVVAEGVVGLGMRLRALCEKMGVAVSDVPLRIVTVAPNMLDKQDVKAFLQDARAQMPLDVDLFVFDTMSQVLPGANENSSEDMGAALRNFKALHKATGGMVCLVGHTGKDAARGHRGWSGIRGALDVELEVERRLTHRALRVTKLKDGKGEGTEVLFDLEPAEVTWDDPEDGPVSEETCVMQPLLSDIERDAVLEQEAQAAQQGKDRAKVERKESKAESAHMTEALDALRALCGANGGQPVTRADLAAALTQGAWADASGGTPDTRLKTLLPLLVAQGCVTTAGQRGKAFLYRPVGDDDEGLVGA